MDGSLVVGYAYRLLPSPSVVAGYGHRWTGVTIYCGWQWSSMDTLHVVDSSTTSLLSPTMYIDSLAPSSIIVADNTIDRFVPRPLSPTVSIDGDLPQSTSFDLSIGSSPVHCRRQYLSMETSPSLLPLTVRVSIDIFLPRLLSLTIYQVYIDIFLPRLFYYYCRRQHLSIDFSLRLFIA